MRNFFRNIPWKQILSFALVAVIGIGAVVGISSAVTEKEKKISPTAFARGAIDSNGQYVESNKSIYTEDLIECQGLRIEPEFEANGTYQIFYYDANKVFMGATEVLDTTTDGVYNKKDDFVLATYCRVMYTPDTPRDDDGYLDEDFEINFFNVLSYAKKINIFVKKEQNRSIEKILEGYENEAKMLGEGIWNNTSNSFLAQSSRMYFFDKVNVSGADYIVMKVATATLTNKVTYSDGQVFRFPYLYDGTKSGVIGNKYSILEQNSEFTYIMYDVSSYTSIFGVVDADSSDVLEIYVLK